MARKATVQDQEALENKREEHEEAAVRRAAAAIDPKARGARKRQLERGLKADRQAAAILPIYLREMGATPLIDEHREVELAKELQDARKGMAALAIKLPAAVREIVLPAGLEGPKRGREWPLDDMETFYKNLVRYNREFKDTRLKAAMKNARGFNRHLDHARDALILANLRLVVHIAKKYLNHGISFMDLIQEGNIGLMKAVEKFEYERGNKFSTYAYWWIKQAIERAIADKARVIRIPVHVNEKIKKISRVARELSERLGRKATPEEIAKKLRMPVTKVEEILGVVQDPQALEDMSADDDSPGLLRFVADPNAPCPLERTVDRELREKIESTLKVLNPREEEIIRLRFGIGRDMPYTLEEIGRVMGLSRERVRQIEATALKKIQSAQECRDLREFLG
ncbi:MAG: sigma-70 family RNA polymerase sigma factor [Acidobacteria bacterium]|uniref:RNA polymerase sigma factor n=1 Tax=Candidatus Polarisedimenticola svalbardensis TaxID=2886004 RepID=A0A8J7C1N8_9BACT|nr:sigma-70 family RNA polymerase sigma factor [Candidatus Polarisedimenticola svalbardensis]